MIAWFMSAIGVTLGVLLTWRMALLLWVITTILAFIGANTGDPTDTTRRINTPGSIAFTLSIWATLGAAMRLVLDYIFA